MTPELTDLYDELQRGRIYECSLRDPKFHLDGFQSGQDVFIDPRPAVLEAVLHELIHRRHPRLGERAVTRASRQLLCKMKDADLLRWWRAYNRIKRKGRPVEIDE